MTATQGDLAALSKFIFRAPNWYSSVGFALVIAAIAGMAAFDSNLLLQDAYEGVFFIGIPTLAASVLTAPLDRWLGGKLTYNRASLLALACEVVVVAMLSVAGVAAALTDLTRAFAIDVLWVGLAVIFALRLAVVMAVSNREPLRAALPASVQTVTAAALLFIYSGTLRYLDPEIGGRLLQAYLARPQEAPDELLLVAPIDFGILAGMCVVYSLAVLGFIYALDRPWRRSLGVSVFDFLQGFIGYVAEGSRELEEFFETLGERAIVPVSVLAFRRPDGTEKARFVLPMIHPGPMGEIGGGDLPRRVAEGAEGLAFPPHATAGHDFNLVTEREVDRLLAAADCAYDRIEYHEVATPAVRAEVGEGSVLGQRFGDDALLVATWSPTCTDDVEYGVGLSAMAEARGADLDDVMLVDAHNCNDGIEGDDLGHVTPGSERSFELYEAAGEAADRLREAPDGAMRLGVAWDPTDWTPEEGIGPLGVRVALLDVEGHETAYVLIDGNNMEPGLRDRLVEAIRTAHPVDEVEVMTSDTHIVNTVESVNQVGDATDADTLEALLIELVGEARADREPVRGGMATERAEVTVFGNDRTETLASHANAVLSIGGALAAMVVLASMALSVLVFLVTPS